MTVWSSRQESSLTMSPLIEPLVDKSAMIRPLRSKKDRRIFLAIAGIEQLEHLNASGNELSRLAPLAGLTTLRQLEIANNRRSKLGTVSVLVNLEGLDSRASIDYIGENPALQFINTATSWPGRKDIANCTPRMNTSGLKSIPPMPGSTRRMGARAGVQTLCSTLTSGL